MLEKHAGLFVEGVSALSELKWTALQSQMAGRDGPEARLRLAKLGEYALHNVRGACILSDMQSVFPELDRAEASLQHMLEMPSYTLETVGQTFKHLISRLQDELRSQHYFHLDQRDVPFYGRAEPFGEKVAAKFPRAQEDLARAGDCLALQQSTAVVFHLMRAMEVVVQRLGKKLGVANTNKEWGKILSDIGTAIEKMPKGTPKEKAKRISWSEAHANLYHVKQAWRNETMHPKQTYDRSEALAVYTSTQVFMAHLAKLL